ncbi:MAG: hypothetical protein OEZ65_10735 [Gemmatimonadota bacterium]|nr:hypothetical protein [Gemmatimonadota bacterium]MDH5760054.1 hypothetical protein [Gemmatimonadota bacterium]
MDIAIAVSTVIFVGAVLIVSSIKATASVGEGVGMTRWMLAVFVAYALLLAVPILFGM